jgi:hypothetical protein
LVATAQGKAGFRDCPQYCRVISAVCGSSALDKPFYAIVSTGEFAIGSRCLGLAGQTKRLSQSELRVAVVGRSLERCPKMPDRTLSIVPAQGQSPSKPGQSWVIVTVGNRPQQGFGLVDIASVERNPNAYRICIRIGSGQCIQGRIGFAELAEPPQVVSKRQPRRPIAGIRSNGLSHDLGQIGHVERLVGSEGPHEKVREFQRFRQGQGTHLSVDFSWTPLLGVQPDEATPRVGAGRV